MSLKLSVSLIVIVALVIAIGFLVVSDSSDGPAGYGPAEHGIAQPGSLNDESQTAISEVVHRSIVTSSFPKEPQGEAKEAVTTTSFGVPRRRKAGAVGINDPGAEKPLRQRLIMSGLPANAIDEFLKVGTETRIERWLLAEPLIEAIAEDKYDALDAKRASAIEQSRRGVVQKILVSEEEAHRRVLADPHGYAIARDPEDGKVFLVDLSLVRHDSATIDRVARTEARLARTRQALMHVILGT